MDELEYYYVTYSALAIVAAAGVVKQKRVEGREPGDFCLANAHEYLLKLLGIPVVITHWRLISQKRADELGRWADQTLAKYEKMADPKNNITHLKLVRGEKPEEPKPIEPGPYRNGS